MSTETAAERMVRQAAERQAAAVAEKAQQTADKAAEVDPKIAASRALQEKQEAEADLIARQNAANELLQGVTLAQGTFQNGVPGVTSNAAGAAIPVAPVAPSALVRTDTVPLSTVDKAVDLEVGVIERPWKTFQHLYANANTIMPNGKKLIFGGQNGHTGTYSTNIPLQIEHLLELALTPGSMVTEVKRDSEGRYIVVNDPILQAETLAALADSRTNTARQQDPNVAQAMNNLGRTIAQDS